MGAALADVLVPGKRHGPQISTASIFRLCSALGDVAARTCRPESRCNGGGCCWASPTPKPEPRIQHFPVARFWEETITIEDEITPDIQLVEDPRFDADERTLLVISWEEVLPELNSSEGQVIGVSWNGRKIGDLDAARSRGTKLLIRNVRGHRGLRSGAYLKLQTSDDFTSFQRRSRAVSRILEGRSQIRNLVSYFDPHGKVAPKEIGAQIADEEIAPYELNADQSDALKHLWKFGPVGLLQGPPGTGKTLFIASIVHYALTRARLRNVLVLSQSNEAVNTAAERILKVSGRLGGSIDLLRVGQHAKISAGLRQYHAELSGKGRAGSRNALISCLSDRLKSFTGPSDHQDAYDVIAELDDGLFRRNGVRSAQEQAAWAALCERQYDRELGGADGPGLRLTGSTATFRRPISAARLDARRPGLAYSDQDARLLATASHSNVGTSDPVLESRKQFVYRARPRRWDCALREVRFGRRRGQALAKALRRRQQARSGLRSVPGRTGNGLARRA